MVYTVNLGSDRVSFTRLYDWYSFTLFDPGGKRRCKLPVFTPTTFPLSTWKVSSRGHLEGLTDTTIEEVFLWPL